MPSRFKKDEYLMTLCKDLFYPEYTYSLSRMRYYKNSRRKNREKTVRETAENYARHLVKKKKRG